MWACNFFALIMYCIAFGLSATAIVLTVVCIIAGVELNDGWCVLAAIIGIVYTWNICARRNQGLEHIFMLPFPKVGL